MKPHAHDDARRDPQRGVDFPLRPMRAL